MMLPVVKEIQLNRGYHFELLQHLIVAILLKILVKALQRSQPEKEKQDLTQKLILRNKS